MASHRSDYTTMLIIPTLSGMELKMTYGDGDGGNYTPFTALDVTGHEISSRTYWIQFRSELFLRIWCDGMKHSATAWEILSDIMENRQRRTGLSVMRYLLHHSGPCLIQIHMAIRIHTRVTTGQPVPLTIMAVFIQTVVWWITGSIFFQTEAPVQWQWRCLHRDRLGIDNAAAICFRMNTVYLVPTSQYADARTYAIQAAIDLFSPCTNEVMQTANAWHAVGVGNAFTPGVTSDFPCSGYSVLFRSGFGWFFQPKFQCRNLHTKFWWWRYKQRCESNTIYILLMEITPASLIADGGSCGLDTVVKMQFVNIDSLNPCIVSLPNTGTATTQTSCSGQFNMTAEDHRVIILDNTNSTIITIVCRRFIRYT